MIMQNHAHSCWVDPLILCVPAVAPQLEAACRRRRRHPRPCHLRARSPYPVCPAAAAKTHNLNKSVCQKCRRTEWMHRSQMQSIDNLNVGVTKIATHRRRVFIWKNNNRGLSVCGCNIGLLWFLLSGWKLTRGGKADVFLFSTGGVVELENVQDGLRILLLLRFTDVGRLKETGPLLRHALHKQTQI